MEKSLNHTTWDCKYHVVFIPKYRKKKIYVDLRKYIGEVFHNLAAQKGCKIVEGHLMSDHVHMILSIPPKYSVSDIVIFMKGKSTTSISRNFSNRQRNFVGENFWARGYFVLTVGKDEKMFGNISSTR